MRIQPIASPAAIPPQGTPEHVRTAKAVEAFKRGASSYDKEAPSATAPMAMMDGAVMNQNSVSAEEMSAIQQPIDTNPIAEDNAGQPQAEVTAPAEAPEAKPAVDPALSRQFAQLARQEKALRAKAVQQEQAWKEREAALVARETEIAAQRQQYEQGYISRDRLKSDPLGVLADAQIGYEDITQQILNRVPTDPRMEAEMRRMQDTIAKLQAQSEQQVKNQEQAQTAQYQAAVKQIEADAKHLVFTDPEFETVKTSGAVKDVVELITRTYAEEGRLLSVEEAARQVEEYLVDEYMKTYQKNTKIKQRLQSVAPKAPAQMQTPSSVSNKQQTQSPMKTLTNATASTRQMSARERAVLAFKGQLK